VNGDKETSDFIVNEAIALFKERYPDLEYVPRGTRFIVEGVKGKVVHWVNQDFLSKLYIESSELISDVMELPRYYVEARIKCDPLDIDADWYAKNLVDQLTAKLEDVAADLGGTLSEGGGHATSKEAMGAWMWKEWLTEDANEWNLVVRLDFYSAAIESV